MARKPFSGFVDGWSLSRLQLFPEAEIHHDDPVGPRIGDEGESFRASPQVEPDIIQIRVGEGNILGKEDRLKDLCSY